MIFKADLWWGAAIDSLSSDGRIYIARQMLTKKQQQQQKKQQTNPPPPPQKKMEPFPSFLNLQARSVLMMVLTYCYSIKVSTTQLFKDDVQQLVIAVGEVL